MVMGDITRIDTVQQYCDLFEVEALHPLVSVVNCYEVQPIRHSKKLYNIYAVLLKDTEDRKSTRLISSHQPQSRMPSSA